MLTPTERKALREAAAVSGVLYRAAGGYWSPLQRGFNETPKAYSQRVYSSGRAVGTRTIRKLVAAGYIEQHKLTAVLTAAGRAAVEGG